MKRILIALFISCFGFQMGAQNLSDLSFGTDTTFEVLTWNIEWFPKNGQSTVDSVKKIITALEVDVLAIQEVGDTTVFKQMVNQLPNYDYYFEANGSYYGGLAYVYNNTAVVINSLYTIYTTQTYWSPFPRAPLVMELSFNNQELVVINNHFKCCGDGYLNTNDSGDEEYRRQLASNLLKNYMDANFPNTKVIMLGDLNDILTDNASNNVFQMYIDDPQNYAFVDMGIANGVSSGWSYPSWPSHLDHILITDDLFDDFATAYSGVQVIKIENHLSGGWSSYDYHISDHRPVAMKIYFDPGNVTVVDQVENKPEVNIYPIPAKEFVSLLGNCAGYFQNIQVYNQAGQQLNTLEVEEAQMSVRVDVSDLPDGVYFIQARYENGNTETRKIVVAR